jgi:hypothetical protein
MGAFFRSLFRITSVVTTELHFVGHTYAKREMQSGRSGKHRCPQISQTPALA